MTDDLNSYYCFYCRGYEHKKTAAVYFHEIKSDGGEWYYRLSCEEHFETYYPIVRDWYIFKGFGRIEYFKEHRTCN